MRGLTISQIAPVLGVDRHTWGLLEKRADELPLTLRWAMAAYLQMIPPKGTPAPDVARRKERAKRR